MKVNGDLRIRGGIRPRIVFEDNTLAQVQYLVEKHPVECQWYHRVQRKQQDDMVIYYITDLFIPEQTVGKTDVESDPLQVGAMWKQVMDDRGLTPQEVSPLIKETTCWSHSHHKMGVSPSPTDDQQWEEQKELANSGNNKDAIQMMMILNKKNEVYNRVWDPVLGLELERVPVLIEKAQEFVELDKIMKERFVEVKETGTKTLSEVRSTPTSNHKNTTSYNNNKSNHYGTHNPPHSIHCICGVCKKKGRKK